MRFSVIQCKEDLLRLTQQVGILPFFTNRVPGWSVEENIVPAIWFSEAPGPWEWKGELASERACVYGKFIRNKAAFVSPEHFADLCNFRRNGLAWEERTENGLAPYRDRLLMEYLSSHPYVMSKRAKRECGFTKGYDGVLTRLQMQTYVIDADFQYDITKAGIPYGWGNAVLSLPERWLDESVLSVPDGRTPQQSLELLLSHLEAVMPDVAPELLRRELL